LIGKGLSDGFYPVSAVLSNDEILGVLKPGAGKGLLWRSSDFSRACIIGYGSETAAYVPLSFAPGEA
jgi:adenosylmethionine-8-amino-7-oxononanoate aminotransferase